MSDSTEQAIYRVREYRRSGEVPKKYQRTYEVIDEKNRQVMAVCDLVGKAVFSELLIADHRQRTWRMRPNRKIMPSRWMVTDPEQQIAMQINQKILGKVVNPLYKTALTLEDGEGRETFRLVDPRTNIPDRIFGVGPGEWALLNGDRPVAKLVRLPRRTETGKGLLGKLKKWLTASDRGIMSAGAEHVLPAPVALGMLLIFNELTDASAG